MTTWNKKYVCTLIFYTLIHWNLAHVLKFITLSSSSLFERVFIPTTTLSLKGAGRISDDTISVLGKFFGSFCTETCLGINWNYVTKTSFEIIVKYLYPNHLHTMCNIYSWLTVASQPNCNLNFQIPLIPYIRSLYLKMITSDHLYIIFIPK